MSFVFFLFFEIVVGSLQIPASQGMVFSLDVSSRNRPILRGSYGGQSPLIDFILDIESDSIYHPQEYWYNNAEELIFQSGGDTENPSSFRIPLSETGSNRQFDLTFSIGAGYNSDLARAARSMMIVPSLTGRGYEMIVSPLDPSRFCADQLMMTTNVHFSDNINEGRGTFSAEVFLLGAENGELIDVSRNVMNGSLRVDESFGGSVAQYHISSLRSEIQLPAAVGRTLREIILAEGGVFNPSRGLSNFLRRGCGSILPRLPTIQFSLKNDEQVVGMILLTPEDYITIERMGGACRLNVDLDHHAYDDDLQLGLSFLEKVGVFFDYENRQIGFFEPI